MLLWFGSDFLYYLGWDLTLFRLNMFIRTLHPHYRAFWPQIQVERFLLIMLVGSLVALAVKGREMVTAIALSLVCGALSGLAYPMWTIMHNAESALPLRVFQLVSSIAILLGAAIVREIRFILARQHPSA